MVSKEGRIVSELEKEIMKALTILKGVLSFLEGRQRPLKDLSQERNILPLYLDNYFWEKVENSLNGVISETNKEH